MSILFLTVSLGGGGGGGGRVHLFGVCAVKQRNTVFNYLCELVSTERFQRRLTWYFMEMLTNVNTYAAGGWFGQFKMLQKTW